MLQTNPNPWLIGAAALSAIAALLHLACIVFGGAWYRWLGAGERMARLAEAGSWYPTIVTSIVAALLLVWALYALSAAGVIVRLPLLRPALCAITAVYWLRGLSGMLLPALMPGRSTAFWWGSSAICLAIGLVHLIGVRQVWAQLAGNG